MTVPVNGNDHYDERVRKQAPFCLEILEREKRAIVGALHIAKRTINNMHPREREVHTFDREEIRQIESNVREKLNNLSWDDESWQEIELTADEMLAIQQGVVDHRFAARDNDREMNDGMKRLENLLGHHTNPRN